ncbi:MAG: metalloregulator ArsR/SmtB family transcription factor [Acidimicrobiia bacterium]|nr:metalloregulator ArsR/SmtB family transcription factor [Acidimicrobiia bacterium]
MELALKALAHEGRREILALISVSESSVNDLAENFPDISGPAVSQHLKVLREAGLVDVRQEGTFRYYRANADQLEELRQALEVFWSPAIDRLNAEMRKDAT